MKQLIVGLGEALWDCLPEGRKFRVAHLQTLLIIQDSLGMIRWLLVLSEMTSWVRKPSMNSVKKV